jgi:hypothetical protein
MNESNEPLIWIDIKLQFENKGDGTAYNPTIDTYMAWLDDPSHVFRTDPCSIVARTEPHEYLHQSLHAYHPANVVNGILSLERTAVLLMLNELRSRARNENGDLIRNPAIWLCWYPDGHDVLFWAHEDQVKAIEPHIARFKAKF